MSNQNHIKVVKTDSAMPPKHLFALFGVINKNPAENCISFTETQSACTTLMYDSTKAIACANST